MKDPIRPWAEKYVKELERTPPVRSLAAQRARLLLSYRTTERRSSWRLPAIAAASVALAVAVAVLWGPAVEQRSSPQRPHLAGVQIEPGTHIDAQGGPRELSFPLGTRAVWQASSKGRLSKFSKDSVELELETGSVEMDVHHQLGRSWVVRAGQFRIIVVGTAFVVDFEGATGAVDVRVTRGRVRVEGPHVGQGHMILDPGERFAWSPQTKADVSEPPPPIPAPQNNKEQPVEPDLKTKAPEPAPDPPHPVWQDLAKAGKFDLAIEQVERLGASQVVQTASADDKILLGNAARYSGRDQLAMRAYRAARTTPGPSSTLAAYYLAKMILDAGGDSAEASRWLRTYLREASGGELAASARARLMTLLQGQGDNAGAVAVAKEYLVFHPNGPHAPAARRILERP